MATVMDTMEVHLPNGSDGDALVHVRLRLVGRSLLFDAGDPRRLADRDVLRLSDLFVSHCHVDHFIGFDALVRPRVCRDDHLTVHGPPGLLDHVTARLAGYTWNLVEGNHFVVTAREVRDEVVRSARFDSGCAFVRENLADVPREAAVHADDAISVTAASLDHHVVSLGWCVQSRPRLSVRVEAVTAHGLARGPWLAELKRAAESGSDRGAPFTPPGGTARPLGEWIDALLAPRAPERVAYVTDTVCDARTRPRIVALAAGADVFACGAPFLAEDGERAARTRHLTAQQAGEMAREAGVKRLLLFHVSDRYHGDFVRHVEEASRAAGGSVEVEVRRETAVPAEN